MSDERKPPADGVDWQPRKSERDVSVRRWKRRLKAAASLGLALAAGTYLACQRTTSRPPVPPNPTTPELRDLPAAPAPTPTPASAPASKDAGAPAADKPPPTQLQRRQPDPPKKGALDKQEHRKGMPVRDNLLE